MMYFLDFDRTLFDTDAFAEYLAEKSRTPETFSPGELSRFVYPDVPEFLRMLGNEAVIVTYGDPTFQKAKIESALHGIPRISAIYTSGELKGPFIAERLLAYGGDAVFVDDTPLHLENVAAHAPRIRLFEARRDGAQGDGRWPTIRSLYDLS